MNYPPCPELHRNMHTDLTLFISLVTSSLHPFVYFVRFESETYESDQLSDMLFDRSLPDLVQDAADVCYVGAVNTTRESQYSRATSPGREALRRGGYPGVRGFGVEIWQPQLRAKAVLTFIPRGLPLG